MRQPRHATRALLNVFLAVLLVATSLLPLAATAEAREAAAQPASVGAAPLADVAAEVGNPSDGLYIKYAIAGYRVTATNKPHDLVGEPTGDTIRATGIVRVSMPGNTVTQASMDAKGVVGMTTLQKQSWPPAGDEGWVGSGQPRRTAELPFDISVPVKAGEAGWISIGGCMTGGTSDCLQVMAAYKAPAAPAAPGATATARATATPIATPIGGAELRARASPLFLPPDGKSTSTVLFTWLENGKPVAGKNVTLGWNGDGALDKPSGVTDGNGRVVATYTAPKLAGNARQQVEVIGRGEGVAEAKALIQLGTVGVSGVSSASRADRGGDQLVLDATIANYHTSAITNVPVEFWDGDPAAGGKLLGTRTIATIPAGGKAWSCGNSWSQCVDWPIGGNATRKKLTVRVPQVAGLGGDAKAPLATREFTFSNYGAPFKTNVDGYNFPNYVRKAGSVEWLEDALALEIANEGLSDGVRVLSYPALVRDFAETWGVADVNGHCFGFAQSSMAYFRDASARPVPGSTFGYANDDPKVRGNISLYHIYQLTSRFKGLIPFGPDRAAPRDSLVALDGYLDRNLADGQPVGISMWGASGGHSVVAYQSTTIDEYGVSSLHFYDSNKPFAALAEGIAPSARLWPSSGAFAYDDFDRVGIDPSIKLPAKAGAVFADLAKTFAQQMMAEMMGGVSPLRLVTFRGPGEPVLATLDGKRLGYSNGQPVTEIPGGKVARLLDSYLFLVPSTLAVKLTAKAGADGTVTVGAATPAGGTTAAPRFPGLALPDPRALFASPTAATVLFDKAPVKAGDAIELQFTGDRATLATGGKPVQTKSQVTVDAATLGIEPPAAAPATPTAAPVAPSAPTGPAASPTFRDPLDGKSDSGASGFSGPSNTNVGATRGVAWVPGKDGQAANLTGMDSFVGYAGSRLKPDQGSIVVRFKPAPDLADTFAKRDPSWKDYGQNKPPQSGFLLDTIGWNPAPKGSWSVALDPSAKGSLSFQIWDGGKWRAVVWSPPAGWAWDPNRWYDIGVTWGPKGMTILVDGDQKAAVPDVVSVSNAIPWFLGQGPWYWPYGPHTLLGAYDDVRVYGEQIAPYAATGGPTAGGQPSGASGSATSGTDGAPNAATVPGIETLVSKPVFGGAGAVVQWTLGSPPNLLGGAAPPAGGDPRKQPLGAASSPNGAPVATPVTASGVANGIASGLSGLAAGGPAAVTLGKAVGVPNGDLTGYLPGGRTGLVAAAADKLPGGTPLVCGLPFLLGGGLFVLLLGAIGLAARPREKRKKSKQTTVQPVIDASYPPPPPAPPAPTAPAPPVPAPASTSFCDQCGKQLSASARFCGSCGAKVDAD